MHDVDLGLQVLLHGPGPALWDIHTQRETLRFLRKRGQDIRRERLDSLIEAILQGPPRHLYRNDLTDDEWIRLRDHEIRLRLYKLTESGVALTASAQQVYDHIQSDAPWQTPSDHSEEFIVFFGAGGYVRQNDADALKNFADMSIEQFTQWSRTQTDEPWEWGQWDGGWGQFAENDVKASVKLLKGAADNEIWPIPPWRKVLDALGQKRMEDVADTIKYEVADLFVSMPLEELAKLDLPVARWFEGTWQKLEENQRRELWRRIWGASLLNEDPEDDLNYDTPLNHAGGILGYILYQEMAECIPKVSAGENPGFPSRLQSDFEKVAEEDHRSAQLARVRIVPMLAFLYRIDPDWTDLAFFRRMNPDDEAAFDPHLWEGYIRFGRWTTDLLKAFKSLLLRTLQGSDLIPEEEVRHRGVGLFIHMAVPPDRGINRGEAKSTLWEVGTEGLCAAAEALGDILGGAGDKSFVLWRDTVGPWFAEVWPRRTRDTSMRLSQKLARMAVDSGDAFPDVVNAIEDILTPEEWSYTLHKLNQASDLVTRHPKAALALVDKIYSNDHGDSGLLGELLETISTAKPELKRAESYKRLAMKAETSTH